MIRAQHSTIILLLSVFCLFACKNDPKTTEKTAQTPVPDTIRVEPVSTEGASTYVITDGTVAWAGKKSIGSPHTGTIKVESGEVLVNQGRLLSGKAVLDMVSIAVTDLKDPGEKQDLESHLKDSDFFEVKKFPKGEFVFDEVLPSNIPEFNNVLAGKLTLKGKTKEVNIPVKITLNGDELVAESPGFVINRTDWGINFQSGLLGTAKDKLIEDVVRLSLKIKAKKK